MPNRSLPSSPRAAASARGPSVLAVVALVLLCLVGAAAVGAALARSHWQPAAANQAEEDTSVHGETVTSDVGASSDGYAVWARNDDGSPVRWDPCTPIDLVVNPAGAPPGAAIDLARAIATVRDATGLHLRITGEVDERPAGDRRAYQPDRYGERWAPVLVSWAQPHENGLPLRDTDRGLAIPVAVGPEGDRTYVTGQVVLNAERTDLVDGFADRATSWGATLVHELVHVVGLAHVDDADQLMHVFPGDGPIRFGEGDLAGLEAVGAEAGCAEVPDARPVRIAAPHRA